MAYQRKQAPYDPSKPNLMITSVEELVAKLTAVDEVEPTVAGVPRSEVERYRKDPLGWVEKVLGVPRWMLKWSLAGAATYAGHQWDGTPDPLEAIFLAVAAGEDVGVESGVGTGKSVLLALVCLWFIACWEGAQVISAAPKEAQLTLYMWRWIQFFFPRFKTHYPDAELGKLILRMDPRGSQRDAWIAIGFVAGVSADEEVATKAAGFHAKDMLIIMEEMPGIKAPIAAAFAQTCVAPHNLRLGVGNPDDQQDALHQFCLEPGVTHVVVSALDHPNVVLKNPELIGGAVTQVSIDKKLTQYGEDGPRYQSRVRGRSPAEASNALIKRSWLHAARDRGVALLEQIKVISSLEELLDPRSTVRLPTKWEGALAVGVDVANSKNGDEAAQVWGRGAIACDVRSEPCPNSNLLGDAVAIEAKGLGLLGDYIGVDGVGIGAGCVNQLLAAGLDIQNLLGNMTTDETIDGLGEEQFANLRAAMWWLAREDLRFGRVIVPDDEDLFDDLVTPTYRTRGGEVLVDPKEFFKKHLGRSPNRGDAFVYWNWVRQVRGGATIGGRVISF